MEKSYKEYLHQITTFIFDIDGVLTDGSLFIDTRGELLRTMNVKDGYALKKAITKGYQIAIISGGTNEAASERLKALGIEDVYLGIHDKKTIFNEYINDKNLNPGSVLYMGDDIPDLPVLEVVGLSTCPQDAVAEVKNMVSYVSFKNGGKGCVRDVIEQVLKVQGKWLN